MTSRQRRLLKLIKTLSISCSGDSNKIYSNANLNKKTKFKLYGDTASPPVRLALMTAKVLGVDLEYKHLDLFKGENKTMEFKKINPLQKVPTLVVDNDVAIADSNAIALFLANSFDKFGVLYPDNQFTRAKIHEYMFYNSGVLFPIDSAIYTSYFDNCWPVARLKDDWYRALNHVNNQLKQNTHLVGNKFTLADLCIFTTVSSVKLLMPLSREYKPIEDWLNRLQKLPCHELNDAGIQRLQSKIKEKESSIQYQYIEKNSCTTPALT